jgi:2'-5' RNA ligase
MVAPTQRRLDQQLLGVASKPLIGHTAPMARLFVAIWPPDDVLDRLADVERPKDQGVKWVPQENLHITLRFLGDADIDEVSARLDATLLPAATAVVGPAFDLLGERSLISPVAGVDELAGVVQQTLRGLGTAPERKRFQGHITVARLARRARPMRSAGRMFDATFDVTEIALVASTLRDTGAVYDTVATWPIR